MTAVATPAELAATDEDRLSLGRIAALFERYRWQVIALVAVAAAQAAANVASPFLLRAIIDRALP